MLTTFFTALLMVFLAELGDKTQLLVAAFATRHPLRTVFWAVALATFALNGLAVAAGAFLSSVLPMEWIKLAAAAAFLAFGLWVLWNQEGGDVEEEEAAKERRFRLSPFWTVAVIFFIAETGDKTQLMAVALSADTSLQCPVEAGPWYRFFNAVHVWLGASLGMLAADAAGLGAGLFLHKRIPERAVHLVSAACFLVFGFLGLDQGLDVVLTSPRHHPWLIGAAALLVAVIGGVIVRRQYLGKRPA